MLQSALQRFREQHGFGRAIAAPQIGFSLRMIALNLTGSPFTMINPIITEKSGVFVCWAACRQRLGPLWASRESRAFPL